VVWLGGGIVGGHWGVDFFVWFWSVDCVVCLQGVDSVVCPHRGIFYIIHPHLRIIIPLFRHIVFLDRGVVQPS
jgi:hypothetical protein